MKISLRETLVDGNILWRIVNFEAPWEPGGMSKKHRKAIKYLALYEASPDIYIGPAMIQTLKSMDVEVEYV